MRKFHAMSKQQAEVLKQQNQPSNDDTLSRVLTDFADNVSKKCPKELQSQQMREINLPTKQIQILLNSQMQKLPR